MSIPKPLPTSRLHATMNPNRIPFRTNKDIPLPKGNGLINPFQPRAMQALDLALQIHSSGYNVYISGEASLGRSYMLLSYLGPRARKLPTPPDIVYVYNFLEPDRPRLICFPPGQGKRFKQMMRETIENIGKELGRRFEARSYVRKRAAIVDQFQKIRLSLLGKINSVAVHKGFSLDVDESGAMTLFPLIDGKRLSEDEFEKLDHKVRLDIRKQGDSLSKDMADFIHQLNKAEETFRDDERELERKILAQVLESLLTSARQKLIKSCSSVSKQINEYFDAVANDIIKNTDVFLPREVQQQSTHASQQGQADTPPWQSAENILSHYAVNLLVDNSNLTGAPIIVEDNPSSVNLLGCIERESEMGALITDFTLIRAGSIHKANGGFLVLHIDDLLQHPQAFEGLLRALRSNQALIEDGGEIPDTVVRTKGITPEPLTLDIKVMLIGCEELYETLLANDDRFAKLFRVKAHLTDVAERSAINIRHYLGHIAKIADENNLLPFDRKALAWLVDLGSHLSEDQCRLSLRFPLLRELMIEAAALAEMRGVETVCSNILEEAFSARTYRANLVEEIFMEEYDRNMIKVQTSGLAIGQVNGLSVTCHSDFEFGLPHRISCTVGVGHDGIIDLEREAELGGPIHTKAMLILKSYLTAQFARTKPLVLSGSLYFEQSYAGIEGDSASGAELVALLSALAEVPVRLDLAFTGAISHSGQIMAVGGVTRKVEGFFKVCARHGLTGSQGVIIPHDNVPHLMLAPDILSAVDNGQFSIYAVRTIDEAIELMTGLNPGRRHKNGYFTRGSLFDLADRRLEELGELAQNAFSKRKSKRNKNLQQ